MNGGIRASPFFGESVFFGEYQFETVSFDGLGPGSRDPDATSKSLVAATIIFPTRTGASTRWL